MVHRMIRLFGARNIKILINTGYFTSFAGIGKRLVLTLSMTVLCNFCTYSSVLHAAEPDQIKACVVSHDEVLTRSLRESFAHCLGWQPDHGASLCLGGYTAFKPASKKATDEIHILADSASFYPDRPSVLKGHVEIQQAQRIVSANTARIYRDAKTNKITKIEFIDDVHYSDADLLMIARYATLHPQEKTGETADVLYRLNSDRKQATIPAWGRASLIKKLSDDNYLFQKATYTTCAPQDRAWDIRASSIEIDNKTATGVARNAQLRVLDTPLLYSPYLTFPTSNKRKSGFLLPQVGYSDIGGLDFGLPYYWNIAPNYDATLVPHIYSQRGVMMGGEFRYLNQFSSGIISGNFLPDDKAYHRFLMANQDQYPSLQGKSDNRWDIGLMQTMSLTPQINFNINAEQVSDDYYLQDFSTNLATMTQRQILRQADVTYTSENWQVRTMAQSYQTLHPVNETPIESAYERLPQVMAKGFYYDLPFDANLNILGQYDQFQWPDNPWYQPVTEKPEGPRFHFNPSLSVPLSRSWGYITPTAQWVETWYQVNHQYNINSHDYSVSLPRLGIDGGLFFERDLAVNGASYNQTIEPRLFYLNVPYQDQTAMPVYDSGYMIFNMDQLFRFNRFSGFDRIGDANQLSYALTTRFISNRTGSERARFAVGQIKYFAQRRVLLCQNATGTCIQDPMTFGYVSSTSDTSPIASRAQYRFNSKMDAVADYVWDPATRATNNSDLIFHYQPEEKKVVSVGYSYLVNGDITQVRNNASVDNALHQAIVAAAWPVSDRWSTVGAYSHNISKNYSMMTLAGVQYDSCCWAMRVMTGHTFRSLNASFEPQYNDNIYIQFLLKGLGSVANTDPYNILSTYIPGYNDTFRH